MRCKNIAERNSSGLDLIQIGADLRRELLSGAQCGDVWDIVETPTPRHWHMMISVTRGRCVSPGRGKLRDHKSGHSGHVMMMSWSLILVTGQGSCLVRPKPALDPDLSAARELCSLQWPGYKGTKGLGRGLKGTLNWKHVLTEKFASPAGAVW